MKSDMIIFSHRGLGFGVSENTLEAYKTALKQGYSLEIDVQKTADDKLVISHDTNLMRQKGIDRNLTEMSFEELGTIGVPSFYEVLMSFKENHRSGTILAIHVKDETQGDLLRILCDEIKEKGLEDACFIFDVTKFGRNLIRSINPNIKIAFSVGEKRYGDTIYLWEDLIGEDFDIVWWDEWIEENLYNEENFKKIKECGKIIYVISPELHEVHGHPSSESLDKIKVVWDSLISIGVDGICTDYPKELSSVLEK